MSLMVSALSKSKDAEEGIIYYSGEETLQLKGDWKFYWKQLYQDDSLLRMSSDYEIVYGPDIWNNYEIKGEKLPEFGYATYGLIIHSDKKHAKLALELPDFYNSYNLYLNGEKLASNGVVGKSLETSLLEWLPQTVGIELEKGDNVMFIEVSNFDHSKGGFFSVITLGDAKTLFSRREFQVMINVFAVGSYFIIGIFLLASYTFWTKDKALLFYALFAICYSIRLSNYGLHLFDVVFTDVPWQISIKIEYLSFYGTWLFLTLFFSVVFKEDFIPAFKYAVFVVSGIVIPITLFAPLKIYSTLIGPYSYFGLSISFLAAYIFIKAVIRKRQGSVIASVGILMMLLAAMITFSMYFRLITYYPYVDNFSNLLAFMSMTFVLSQRFAVAFQTVERLKTEAQKTKELQSKWFTNISHELRTPLTLINGQLEALQKSKRPNLDDEQRIISAKRNASQLEGMIEDLLDLSKLELSKSNLRFSVVDVASVINRSLMSFHSLADSKKVRLDFKNLADDKIYANLDVRQFEKVINNLLYNAFKFTQEQGNVIVKLYADEWVHVEISDTGIGIASSELPHIFDRFYQADNQQGVLGSGLGLAISKEIVELHQGEIEVKSKVGLGTFFTIALPRQYVDVDYQQEEIQELPKLEAIVFEKLIKNDAGKPRVLIVEDNQEMSAYLSEIFSENFDIANVTNGRQGLDWLKVNRTDLIISDVMMPEMGGFELLSSLKKSATLQNIPFILLTARAAKEDRVEGLRLGVDDYITKPFDRDELLIRAVNLVHNLQNRVIWAKEIGVDELPVVDTKDKSHLEDEKLVRLAGSYIESRISQSDLSVKDVAVSVALSERQFYRKIRLVTGMTPAQFIMEVKLQYARKLLISGKIVKLSQLTQEVGLSSDSYFSKLFYERFGKRPSSYILN